MDPISLYRQEIEWAHDLLERVMVDVTPEMAHQHPPGIANPIGATYAHALMTEDGVSSLYLTRAAPLFQREWAGKTGVSQPRMGQTLEWSRSLQVDLPAARQYAQAVYTNTGRYLDSLTELETQRVVNLSGAGLGKRTVSWVLSALIAGHVHNMAGEISALKGVLGAKGYPF